MSRLLSLEERERRLRVIEEGVKTEFWKILRQSIEFYNFEKMNESVELHGSGKSDEAARLALEVKALKRFLEEPDYIIRANKSLFDKFIVTACGICNGSGVIRKLKEILKGNQTHGGNNDARRD